MIGKTETRVHSEAQMLAQRSRALARDQRLLASVSMYVQMSVGFSLYLYSQVSTPGYLSLLVAVPFPLLLIWLARRFSRFQSRPRAAADGSRAGLLWLCFAMLHLLDAQLAFFALCALARDVMPDGGRLPFALAAALFCALGNGDQASLPRLAGLLKWAALLLALYCAGAALPHGKAAHFFPLLGRGPVSIFQGALWMSGTLASGVWPLLIQNEKEPPRRFFSDAGYSIGAVGLALIKYLTAVWLMPVHAMARPESLGWRMLLITHMTPSILAWSFEVIGWLLLLLAAVCCSAAQAAAALSRSGGKKQPPRFLTAALLFLLVPACCIDPERAETALSAIAPWRAAAALLPLGMLSLMNAIRKKRNGKAPGGEP